MKHLMALMGDSDNPLPVSMKQEYIEQYSGLEIRKLQIEAELMPEQQDGGTAGLVRLPVLPVIRFLSSSEERA